MDVLQEKKYSSSRGQNITEDRKGNYKYINKKKMKEHNVYVAKISVKNSVNTTYYVLANSLKEALDIADGYVKENPKLYYGVVSIEKASYKIIIPKNTKYERTD